MVTGCFKSWKGRDTERYPPAPRTVGSSRWDRGMSLLRWARSSAGVLPVALVAAAACGAETAQPADAGSDGGYDSAAVVEVRLVGPRSRSLSAGSRELVQIAVVDGCGDAAKGEKVGFRLVGSPADSKLSVGSATTGADGKAAVILTAGEAAASFRVYAFHVATSKGAYVEISVVDRCSEHCRNGRKDCGEEGTDCGGKCGTCGPKNFSGVMERPRPTRRLSRLGRTSSWPSWRATGASRSGTHVSMGSGGRR